MTKNIARFVVMLVLFIVSLVGIAILETFQDETPRNY